MLARMEDLWHDGRYQATPTPAAPAEQLRASANALALSPDTMCGVQISSCRPPRRRRVPGRWPGGQPSRHRGRPPAGGIACSPTNGEIASGSAMCLGSRGVGGSIAGIGLPAALVAAASAARRGPAAVAIQHPEMARAGIAPGISPEGLVPDLAAGSSAYFVTGMKSRFTCLLGKSGRDSSPAIEVFSKKKRGRSSHGRSP